LLVLFGCLSGCGPRGLDPAHLQTELGFFRLGVDRDAEEQALRRVFAQRRLHIVTELRTEGFVAFGAESIDGKTTAIRVLSSRGIVFAEDATLDDLFAPATLALVESLPTRFGEMEVLAFSRVPRGADLGCVRLLEVRPDGTVAEAELDVSPLGSRACVALLGSVAETRVQSRVGFPGLAHDVTPALWVPLELVPVPLGRPMPTARRLRLASAGNWLSAERDRLGAAVPREASFSELHALGVARAAVASLAGESTDRQVAAYRSSLPPVRPGSVEAAHVADAVAHIERGWLDTSDLDPAAPVEEGTDIVITPEGDDTPAPEGDDTRIEPP
jgi:hypothetical protein